MDVARDALLVTLDLYLVSPFQLPGTAHPVLIPVDIELEQISRVIRRVARFSRHYMAEAKAGHLRIDYTYGVVSFNGFLQIEVDGRFAVMAFAVGHSGEFGSLLKLARFLV